VTPARRPAGSEHASYYARYVALVPDGAIADTLRRQIPETVALVKPLTEGRARHRYAPGKWSVKEVLGHVADSERVFAYRALWFARSEGVALPGFDENSFAANAGFDERPLEDLIAELEAVRAATVALFRSLDDAAWDRSGVANDAPVSVRALAWIIAGHELHHRGILAERYL
jgi:uncharacterized damage-inducible protein DinB